MDFPIFLIIFAVSKQLKALIMEIQDLMVGDFVRYKKLFYSSLYNIRLNFNYEKLF